ncbi:hypothetical protein B0H14DRAFT_2972152 [Mycena olivaceomarginata]|nr:hypothetical protein B0H14DRAFT_2972152 [Mycena olivaceomarginata]
MGASSNDADTALALGDGEHSIPSPAALKAQAPILLSSSESNSALGPAPSKRARRSRNAGATGVGASPPESPTEQDGFSILNELAEETQQRNAQQEIQSLNLGAEYRSSAQLDLDSDYTAEILPDFLLHDPSSPILDHGNDDQNTRPEILSTSPDFFPATVLHEDESDSRSTKFVEPDRMVGTTGREEMDLDANPFDSGGSEEDSESIPDIGKSRCPCNLCSPRAPTNPDYHPSRQSQQEIHRLFSQSPFAHPTPSTL